MMDKKALIFSTCMIVVIRLKVSRLMSQKLMWDSHPSCLITSCHPEKVESGSPAPETLDHKLDISGLKVEL